MPPYASMYQFDTGEVVNIAAVDQWVQVAGFFPGELRQCSVASDKITVDIAGRYLVSRSGTQDFLILHSQLAAVYVAA